MQSGFLDKKGRPLIAVTGMGVVTSLGRGKEENWRRLIAGESGIRHITRFPTDGLRTTIAGTVEELEPAPRTAARSQLARPLRCCCVIFPSASPSHGRPPTRSTG